MPVREILLFPDETLKKPCQEVRDMDASVLGLLTDLTDTLYASPGVGLAAPQIHILLRAVVVDVTRPPPGGRPAQKGHGLIALANPRILRAEGEQIFREGCLSIPEFLANVKRAAWIQVEGLDRRGEKVRLETDGFEAVALQHEIDHLDGVLFLDRVTNVKTDLFRRKKSADKRPAGGSSGPPVSP
jgi:peptide deformylase